MRAAMMGERRSMGAVRVGQPRPASAAARRFVSASRSQMAFDSVALRLTTPLLKLGKAASDGGMRAAVRLPGMRRARPPCPLDRTRVDSAGLNVCSVRV
jgi:hypothetical protein